MVLIDNEYRLTVRELIDELSQENQDAVIVIQGKGRTSNSIYKTEVAADDSCVFLYLGGIWPHE